MSRQTTKNGATHYDTPSVGAHGTDPSFRPLQSELSQHRCSSAFNVTSVFH